MVSKGNIGGIFGAIGCFILLLSLFINNLSGYSYYKDGLGKTSEKCEWNKICRTSLF